MTEHTISAGQGMGSGNPTPNWGQGLLTLALEPSGSSSVPPPAYQVPTSGAKKHQEGEHTMWSTRCPFDLCKAPMVFHRSMDRPSHPSAGNHATPGQGLELPHGLL